MVISGATGGIGSELLSYFDATPYDPRREEYPEGHDVFINCAGLNIDGLGCQLAFMDFKNVIGVNLIGAFGMTSFAIRDMRSRGRGRIIHLSSMLSEKTVKGTCAYSASKAGLNAMVRVIASENKDILINTLNLGYVDAGMALELPVKRMNIREVIRACEMLIDSDTITGQSINIW